MIKRKELVKLGPVLEALLSSGTNKSCAKLLLHLEDKFLSLVLRGLRSFLYPFGKGKIKIQPQDLAPIRAALQPFKKDLLKLAKPGTPSQKRAQLHRALTKNGDKFRGILSAFVRTLHDIINTPSAA